MRKRQSVFRARVAVVTIVSVTTVRTGQNSDGDKFASVSGPGSGAVAKNGNGDVYAGKDGNVYKKSGDGYQKYENGDWNTVEGPSQAQKDQAKTNAQAGAQSKKSSWDSGTASQVTSDAAARSAGTQRTSDLGRVSSGTTSRTSSYRPTGGGARARGGRGGR